MLPVLAVVATLVLPVAVPLPAPPRDTVGATGDERVSAVDSIPAPVERPDPTPWAAFLQARERLADRGLTLAASHAADASSMAARSPAGGATALRGLLALAAEVDLEAAAGIPGASLLVEHQTLWGEDGSALLGALQGFSSIDAEPFRGFAAARVEQSLLQDRLRWQAGRMDVNAEFAASENAGGFVNPAMGLTPTMSTAPTYPAPALAATLVVEPWRAWGAGVGLYRAAGAGQDPEETSAFLVAESRVGWGDGGRLAVGGWRHAAPGPAGDAGAGSPGGWYAILDQVLWSSPRGAVVAAFTQVAGASVPGTPSTRHLSGGVVARGIVGTPGHELGLGATWLRPGDHEAPAGERIVEAYLLVPAGPWSAIQVDVQHLGGSLWTGSEAWVSTVRLLLAF